MQPDSPAADSDDSQQQNPAASPDAVNQSHPPTNPTIPSKDPAKELTTPPFSLVPGLQASPLETLQRRYADQLSQDIEQLEAQKTRLQQEISSLRQDYVTLHAQAQRLRQTTGPAGSMSAARGSEATLQPEKIFPAVGPVLPGETEATGPPPAEAKSAPLNPAPKSRSIELPTPATSEQRRRRSARRKEPVALVTVRKRSPRKGIVLSAIATALIAWHYGAVSALGNGGSWLGLGIDQLGSGFLPMVALLWLRMLVMVPALLLLAPQLHTDTWEDLQDWFYNRERVLILLIGSGVALFFSQVFLYQSVGLAGPVVATALLFLYPLIATPLGLGLRQEQGLSGFGLLAMVAIAMGGFLTVRPILSTDAPATWLGLLASLAFSLYIVLTNLSYRQQCHPIPAAVVQFSTVAVVGSLILLVKPLTLVSISWTNLFFWGVAIGVLMLLAYLFNYSSLRAIGPRTSIVAATTPLMVLLLTWGFQPGRSLEIIQYTGIALIAMGGVALGKEKLTKP
ncbi:MAG: EamA family transporter [Cyanobacteria bacterium J06623_4]